MAPLSTLRKRCLACTLCLSAFCLSVGFAAAEGATTAGSASSVSNTDTDLFKPLTPVAEPLPVAAAQSGGSAAVVKHEHLVLSGHASKTIVKSELGKVVSDLLATSLSQNSEYQDLEEERTDKHPFKAVAAKVGTILGEVVAFNSSAASKDGARIAMDDMDDWDEKDALVYKEQKLIDELHPKIAGALLQVAMGRGAMVQDEHSQEITERGLEELSAIVGAKSRQSVGSTMNRWLSEADSGYSGVAKSSDLLTTRKNIKLLTAAAVADDPVLLSIRQELQHFAKPNKVKDVVSNTLQTVLDTTAYTMPTGGIAAAVEAIKGVVVASTGGPEEDKLTHMLFLLKRIESRRAALNEEIQLALYGKEVGVQTNNKLLIKCADAVIGNLVTVETVSQIAAKDSAVAAKADSEHTTH